MSAVVYNITMVCLAAVAFVAVVHPKVETGFWVTLGLAGVFGGAVSALEPTADLSRTVFMMSAGNLVVMAGVVSRTMRANKNCRLSGWGRRATDGVICGRWTQDRPAQGAGSPPVSDS